MKKSLRFCLLEDSCRVLVGPSRETFGTATFCARGIVHPQASPLMKFSKESVRHKQKDNCEIVPDADIAVDLAGSKLTSVALSIWYICATSMGMSDIRRQRHTAAQKWLDTVIDVLRTSCPSSKERPVASTQAPKH